MSDFISNFIAAITYVGERILENPILQIIIFVPAAITIIIWVIDRPED